VRRDATIILGNNKFVITNNEQIRRKSSSPEHQRGKRRRGGFRGPSGAFSTAAIVLKLYLSVVTVFYPCRYLCFLFDISNLPFEEQLPGIQGVLFHRYLF